MAVDDQCKAVLPNDRRMQHDDGYKCCSLRAGHEGAHRTGYVGAAACEGDPAWTFDVAAIHALPSAYVAPARRPPRLSEEEQKKRLPLPLLFLLGGKP